MDAEVFNRAISGIALVLAFAGVSVSVAILAGAGMIARAIEKIK